jgi:ethanolamine-phosphate cytidylyltransferase
MDTDCGIISSLFQLIEARQDLKETLLGLEIQADQSLVNEKLTQLVAYLENLPKTPQRLPVRIYMAACLDIIHSGHFNCMRQSKALGDVLVLGVIADDEILRCKGPPVMKQFERRAIAEACKWVDEVIDGVPYYVTVDLLKKHNCDYVVHGDDIAIRKDTGTDAYEEVRNAKMLKIVKRTEGISTTEMVGKMLLMTGSEARETEPEQVSNLVRNTKTSFLATTRRINQFSSATIPAPGSQIVYIDGSFDLLHVGHLETLKRAKAMGDYLIVGIHDDKTVHSHKGKNYPIMNLHERTLNLLALKYVDDVIMGAPWEITEDMIRTLNISIVVQGTHHKDLSDEVVSNDAYNVPKQLGIYREIESAYNLTTDDIVRRIVDNRMLYIQRNTRMTANENKYYENKGYVQEL